MQTKLGHHNKICGLYQPGYTILVVITHSIFVKMLLWGKKMNIIQELPILYLKTTCDSAMHYHEKFNLEKKPVTPTSRHLTSMYLFTMMCM